VHVSTIIKPSPFVVVSPFSLSTTIQLPQHLHHRLFGTLIGCR
jgi:hypothetical protein